MATDNKKNPAHAELDSLVEQVKAPKQESDLIPTVTDAEEEKEDESGGISDEPLVDAEPNESVKARRNSPGLKKWAKRIVLIAAALALLVVAIGAMERMFDKDGLSVGLPATNDEVVEIETPELPDIGIAFSEREEPEVEAEPTNAVSVATNDNLPVINDNISIVTGIDNTDPFETFEGASGPTISFRSADPLLLSSTEQQLEQQINELTTQNTQLINQRDQLKDALEVSNLENERLRAEIMSARNALSASHQRAAELSKYVDQYRQTREAADSRPQVLVNAILAAPAECSECSSFAHVLYEKAPMALQTGDKINGFEVVVGDNFVRLYDAFSSFSYFPIQK